MYICCVNNLQVYFLSHIHICCEHNYKDTKICTYIETLYQKNIYVLTYCKICIYYPQVNSKFTVWSTPSTFELQIKNNENLNLK